MAARRKQPGATKAHREFVSEAEEILERMRDDLARLAEAIEAGRAADPDTVNALFRSAHSLKGLSGMFGLDAMMELAHHLENVLDGLRMGRTRLDTAGLALFDESVSLVANTLEKLDDADAREHQEDAIGALVARIDAWTSPEVEAKGDLSSLEVPTSLLRALTEYEEHRVRENMREGRNVYVVDSDFEIMNFEEGLATLADAVRGVGEQLATLPSPGETADSQIRFSLLVASELGSDELAERIGIDTANVLCAYRAPVASTTSAARLDPRRGERDAPSEEENAPEQKSLKSISDTVRVDIRKLDELMNLVGELAIQRSAIKSIADTLASTATTARIGIELSKIHKTLERKLQDLQSSVLDVRMVPLRQVFDKLSRVARRLRVDLGKQVDLEIRGADTELDKLIVEELVDPLMHLVRNAFDHAIEAPDERTECGKDPVGRIVVEATQRGNDVVISVGDDGRGIDPVAVLHRARETGLVGADHEPGRKEILMMIFSPGLSTRDVVSETSGRGVGMDVVRSNIAELGGIVDVESELGRGTTVTMTLPITLAIIQALIVGVGDERFAVPLNSVRETLLVEPGEIQRSDGRQLLNLRGEPLLLRRLGEEFGIASAAPSRQYAVVLGIGDARLGLLVDRLEGQQDTVIKPIQGPVPMVRGIAGATELGDRGPVLVLDVSALVEDAVRSREAA